MVTAKKDKLYLRRVKPRIGVVFLLVVLFIAVSVFLPYHIVDDTDNVQNVRLTYYGETIEEHKEVLCDEESVQELLTIVSDMKYRRTLDTFNQVNPDRITPNQIEIDLILNGKSHHIVLSDRAYYYSSGESFSRRKIINAEEMLMNVQAIIDKNESKGCGE